MTVTASLRDAHRKSAKDPVAVVIGGYDTPRSSQTPRSRGSNRRFDDVLATHNPTFARTSTTTAPTVTPTTIPTTNPQLNRHFSRVLFAFAFLVAHSSSYYCTTL